MPWAPLLKGCGAGRESAAHNRRADRDVGHRRRPPNNVQSTMPRPHTRALTPVAHIPPRTHGIAEDADHGYDRARDRARGSPGLPPRVRLPLARDGPDPSGPGRHPEALGERQSGGNGGRGGHSGARALERQERRQVRVRLPLASASPSRAPPPRVRLLHASASPRWQSVSWCGPRAAGLSRPQPASAGPQGVRPAVF